MRVHFEKLMKYATNNDLLKKLKKTIDYNINIDHYAFRRWAVNEINLETYIQRERKSFCWRSCHLKAFID